MPTQRPAIQRAFADTPCGGGDEDLSGLQMMELMRTEIDETCELSDTIFVSRGRRGHDHRDCDRDRAHSL